MLIALLLLFSSCFCTKFPLNENNSAIETGNNISTVPIEANEIEQYNINDPERGLSLYDFETVFLLCKDFINQYYSAITNTSEMYAEEFISNENLIYFVNKLIDNETYPTTSKVDIIKYGLINIEWHEEQQYVFLNIAVDVSMDYGGGFGEVHEFLIQNQDNRLIIVDWYMPGMNTFSVYREQKGHINDPSIWDNEAWVTDLKTKIKIYED